MNQKSEPIASSFIANSRSLEDPDLQKLADKISDLKLNAPAVFFLESIFPLRQSAYCCTEFCAPIAGLFFKNSFDILQKLLSNSENYQEFVNDLEAQATKEGRIN
jgi:hypothetical protein